AVRMRKSDRGSAGRDETAARDFQCHDDLPSCFPSEDARRGRAPAASLLLTRIVSRVDVIDASRADVLKWTLTGTRSTPSFDYAISARLNLRRNSNTEVLRRFGVDR